MSKHLAPLALWFGRNPSAASPWKSSASVAAVVVVAVTRTCLAARAAVVVAVVQELRLSSTQRQTFLQPLR
jgi:hypothetical protein